ncbi:MAG: hypothetical protein M1820_006478 [Bogoriella megaspora]|nr:MAG: hypothetical protein M1820_006478 [Bogoriella megaspora]
MALSDLGNVHHDTERLAFKFPLHQISRIHDYSPNPPVLDTCRHVQSKQALNRDRILDAAGPIAIPRRRPHTRSLTDSMAVATMIIPEDATPSSPPELTDSRSSKSSSSNSSTTPSELTGDELNHFEDIALEDVHEVAEPEIFHSSRKDIAKRPVLSVMAQRPPHPSGGGLRPQRSMGGLRDLTNVGRPQLSGPQGQPRGLIQDNTSLNLPNGKRIRRNFTSPSSPSLPTMITSGTRSRSPSPTPQTHLSTSPRALPPRRIRTHSPNQRFAPRRQSWQPSRKSIKEREAECNDDSDEELPEDAIIHNVPLSPGIGQRSATPSPERRSSTTPTSTADGEYGFKDKHTLATTTIRSREVSPHSSSEPSTSQSLPSSAIPEEHPAFFPPRTKSWNIAMSDLSKEAQELSIALETHAEEVSLSRHSSFTLGDSSRDRPDLSLHRSKTASTVELPPIRKGNIMIDPLPISKEKEAVLTRTRPSWLPPKSQKEEKRHLKEYQRMMALSAELDKRKAAKLEAAQQQLVEQRGTVERIWETYVLPSWDQAVNDPKTRELWWKGVATKARGEVWQKALGNELGLNDTSYERALTRAKAVEKEIAPLREEEAASRKESDWFKAIKRDAGTAFPELGLFQPGGPMYDSLVEVLMAYAMYRSDVGYVYGTHLPAALLLLTLPTPASTFTSLANLLNRPFPLAHLLPDPGALARAHNLVLSTLSYKLPRLHQHLTNPELDLYPEEWIDPMMRSLFCARLGVDEASRLWDVYVFEGDRVLIRAVVGCLIKLEGKLYGTREEILSVLGWPDANPATAGSGKQSSRMWDVGSEEDFMVAVREAGKVEATPSGARSPLPA